MRLKNTGIKQKQLIKLIKIDKSDRYIFDEYSIHMNKYGYIICEKRSNNKKIRYWLHRLILGNPLNGLFVDHINRNKLDNRKSNLRLVTSHINSINTPKRSHSNQIYKGIQKLPYGKWRAKATRGKHLGVFNTPEEAYNKWKSYTEKEYGILIEDGI